MKNVLLTGSTGFIGRNVLPLMQTRFAVATPTHLELDLSDVPAVRRYLDKGQFDAVVHMANPTGKNTQILFEDSLRVFSTLESCTELFGKMIYIGSGAEYGKHKDISMVSESTFGKRVPIDSYGLSRYIMSKIAERHDNIINLRLFACCGPSDQPSKLIPHIINSVLNCNYILLNQDVWFDYLFVEDIFPILEYFIEKTSIFRAYNLCSGRRILISTIAEEVRRQMESTAEIVFRKNGLNYEYTASNIRIRNELPDWRPRSISDCVRAILEREA